MLDAVSANLGILKSPTVLRQENGNMWGWEGCFPDNGCCHGSCTHVWNYAQAFPHLFPQLERTLRDLELVRSMDERGHVNFRGAIPDGPVDHNFHAASDGQLGGIMKLYRDWQISGDTAWLKRMYPLAKRSLDYGIRTWDPGSRGALVRAAPQYLRHRVLGRRTACAPASTSARFRRWRRWRRLSARASDAEFYARSRAASARSTSTSISSTANTTSRRCNSRTCATRRSRSLSRTSTSKSSEMQQLLKREGPEVSVRTRMPFRRRDRRMDGEHLWHRYAARAKERSIATLQAIFKHNFKTDLSQHANAQRPGYAMGREPGLLLCSWPRGSKPTLPFVYSDEVWTGIEYQVASHLIQEGLVDEGLDDREGGAQPLRRAHPQSVERVRVRQLVCARHVELRTARARCQDSAIRLWKRRCGSLRS